MQVTDDSWPFKFKSWVCTLQSAASQGIFGLTINSALHSSTSFCSQVQTNLSFTPWMSHKKKDFLHLGFRLELAWPHFPYTQYDNTIVLACKIRALRVQDQLMKGKYFQQQQQPLPHTLCVFSQGGPLIRMLSGEHLYSVLLVLVSAAEQTIYSCSVSVSTEHWLI